MSQARAILSNTVVQIIGKAVSAIVSVLIVKIITNYLSVEGYGEYTAIYEFLALFAIAADLGLFTIGVREMSKDEDKIQKIAGNILGLRMVLAIIMMTLATLAAFLIPKYDNTLIPIGCAIAGLTTVFSLLNGTVAIVLQVKLKMHWMAITFILGRLVTLAYMVYIVFYGIPEATSQGFYHLLVAGVLGNGLMFVGTAFFANRYVKLRPQFDLALWKSTIKESLPYGMAIILNAVYFRVDSILLSLMKGTGEVGLYGVPMRMLEVMTVIPLYFMNSVLPVLTKSMKEKTDKYKKIIQYSWEFLISMAAPIMTGTVLLAYPIIYLIASPDFLSKLEEGFYGSDVALQILIFAMGFQFLNVLFAFLLISVGKQSKLLYINAACVLFNIIGNIILIPEYGFRGAAFTSVLSELFILIGTFIAARHYMKFKIELGGTLKILFSTAVMGVVVYFLKDRMFEFAQAKGVFLMIPIAVLVYAGMLFLTGAISREKLKMLKR